MEQEQRAPGCSLLMRGRQRVDRVAASRRRGSASGSVPGCSQGTSFDRLRAHCPGARFALAKRKSAPRRPGARCSSQASVRPLNSATFASPHESRSAPVPSPVPASQCRGAWNWGATAVPVSVALAGESESAPFRRLGHIAAVLHDGVRGYAAVSPVEPLSSVRTIRRACRLAGGDAEGPAPSPWLAPSCARGDLRSRWGRRAERRSLPPPSCAQRARIEAPRGIRSGDGPHADRRSPRGL